MILPDVNVLIYAFSRDVPQHATCRAWIEATILDEARFGVSPVALSALVAITTSVRFYPSTSLLDEAFGFCEEIMAQPNCEVVQLGERH